MAQNDLRTYRRRSSTRESGYHTCEETTGGECIIQRATQYVLENCVESFTFYENMLELVELFEKGISIIAFGGYIHASNKIEISFSIDYIYEGQALAYSNDSERMIEADEWTNIGYHVEQVINVDNFLTDVTVKMSIKGEPGTTINFIAFGFGVVSKEEFIDNTFATSFYQKTNMHIPYLYYLNTEMPFDTYLTESKSFSQGIRVVLKSCNRCGRYLPINIDNELKTLSFSLHCKKRAPCVHSTFRAYEIKNTDSLDESDLRGLTIRDNKIISYYGHQLECKACKKFFVNAPLNPQRNAQQFKEDGLRRRALERLVNILQKRNLVHFEFERKTKKEFSEYIWNKFDKKCFKCGVDSAPIKLSDMALDHTMPLAYLYRLDETATCLCSSHNSQKSDHFPVDYYTEGELHRLSEITGLSMEKLHSKEVNRDVLELLIKNVVWFFDEFLTEPDYQKVRDGILTADKINDSLKRVIGGKIDLAELYRKKTGDYPHSVTVK